MDLTQNPFMSAIREISANPEITGLNILIMGPSGSGKTYSIHELVTMGFEVFCLMTESGLESLLGYWTDKGQEVPPNLHWHTVRAKAVGFKEMVSASKDVLDLTYEMLIKKPDTNKRLFTGFTEVLESLANFKDDRTGELFGAADDWGPDRWLCIDSLTGISNMAMQNMIGGKVVRDQKDWQVAQGLVENLLRMCTDGCRCNFLIIGHIEREVDPVLGGAKIMASTLGKALAPKLPIMFSELLFAESVGDKWEWVTNNPQADTKSRYLPKGRHPQSFKPIVAKWAARMGVLVKPA